MVKDGQVKDEGGGRHLEIRDKKLYDGQVNHNMF
jgi:hypothetical protein